MRTTKLKQAVHVLALMAGLLLVSATMPSAAQTTVAGTTPGAFSVSESGAATYRIPIKVPPGIAGMEPKLELAYNSLGGNGLLGPGWGLSGLSAITRCPQTVATDGVRGSVAYTVADRFCLDGQRLIVINAGTYGAAGTEYRTEVDSFSRVVANGAANGNASNGPDNFVVKTKTGVSLEYGTTADSRIEAQGKAVVRVWALRKMTDTKGNYLTVSYTEDSTTGEFYPLRIDYTGYGNQAPGNSVRFVMETCGFRLGPLTQAKVIRTAALIGMFRLPAVVT